MLVEILEDFVLPKNHRATVCKFATRHFVLVGRRDRERAESEVHGPFDNGIVGARTFARGLQLIGYETQERAS